MRGFRCARTARFQPWLRPRILRSSGTTTPTSITIRYRAVTVRLACASAWRRHFPDATLRRWHDALVGPHPQSMYQIAFPSALLASFLPWLMLNRDGLTILLHPGTGNAYADHTDHAGWFGSMLPLRLDVLRAAQEAPASDARPADARLGGLSECRIVRQFRRAPRARGKGSPGRYGWPPRLDSEQFRFVDGTAESSDSGAARQHRAHRRAEIR